MPLLLIGLNHKTAPIAVREKLAQLCGIPIPEVDGFNLEAVPVFTCNRVEIYFSGNPEIAKRSFISLLQTQDLNYDLFSEHFYELEGIEAVKHLFGVAAGLDSMILGENQILHQLKESYKYSTGENIVGKQLHTLFQKALEVGKKVRNETAISENKVSIASAAVDLAKKIFGPLKNSVALIIGAGEMASLVATHLKESGISKMYFINRTTEKAKEFAQKFDGFYAEAEELEKLLSVADICITSTGAPGTIIKFEQMKRVMNSRNGNPMFAIDIAVPRDIDEECQNIPSLFLYDVDDLQSVVDENLNCRKIEAEKARTIVNYESSEFQLTQQSYTVIPLIRGLRERAEEIRLKEVEKFLSQNSSLEAEIVESFIACSKSLMAKLIHDQIINLKKQGSADKKDLKLISEILGLASQKISEIPIRELEKKQRESV